jgi:DNA adenine methylase
MSNRIPKGGTATSRPAFAPPLKWHIDGGKTYLAQRIIALMPPRCKNPNAPDPADKGWLHYVEPYFGGGAVLLANDPEGIGEIANDINGTLTNFWKVLQCADMFGELQRWLEATPFSAVEFERAQHVLADEDKQSDIAQAWAFFVACRQSLAARMKGFTTVAKTRTRRGMNEAPSAWLNAIEGLPAVHARLKRVLILNRDALDVIRQQDGPATLFYLDPPYLHETRVSTDAYAHEMTADQHRELLVVLAQIQGRFLLSGYRSQLYDVAAEGAGWTRHDFEIANHSAGGKDKRRMVECVWVNY